MNPFANFFIIQNATAIAARKHKEDDVCPSCDKPEDIICKCRHCGHEYNLDDEAEVSGWSILFWVLVVVAFVVLLTTFMQWTLKIDDKGFDRTYVQYLGDQLTYFWEKIVLNLI